MAELSLEDPSDPSKLIRFIVLLQSRKEKYLMKSLRGDGEHQCLHQTLSSQKLSYIYIEVNNTRENTIQKASTEFRENEHRLVQVTKSDLLLGSSLVSILPVVLS